MRRSPIISVLSIAIAASFITLAHAQSVGVTLPSVPASISATLEQPSQISVSWSASTESSGTIEGYYVYRNGTQFTATVGTSLVDSGLPPGVYIYTVAAYDANGVISNQSSPASVTLIADTTPPTAPTDVSVTGPTSTNSTYSQVALTISWAASTDNVGVVGYYVYRNGIQIVSSTSAFTGTSVPDTVGPGAYTYKVIAYDAAQNFSNDSMPAVITIGVDDSAPSTPTNIAVQQSSATGANVSWSPSTDNIGVAGYQVYRNGVQVASATGSPYADSGLSTGIEYAYAVTAYDSAGNISAKSTPVAVTIAQTNGPTTPLISSATLLSTSTVRIQWSPSGDVLLITGYNVYRDNVQIATVTSTNYLDEGVASGTYTYSVNATDLSGTVSASSSATVIVPSVETAPAPEPVATIPVIITPSSTFTTSTAAGQATALFTQFLYFGLRSSQVESLQSLLAGSGYLLPANATGYFGNLTLHALQKFQCNQNIVCTGGPGWGTVGPRTRGVLNGLEGTPPASDASTSALNAEISALQAELMNLERQMQ